MNHSGHLTSMTMLLSMTLSCVVPVALYLVFSALCMENVVSKPNAIISGAPKAAL
jgi:hypothetical protein